VPIGDDRCQVAGRLPFWYHLLIRLGRENAISATREKLRLLEERYAANVREQGGDEHVRELSMRSLKRLINQLK
jgi:hypothetical protein